MKKKLYVALALIIALSMVLAACGGGGGAAAPEPAPAPAPAPAEGGDAPAPAPVDDGKTYPADIAVTLGEPVSPSWVQLFKDLEAASDGKIPTTVYWSGSLLPIPEIPKGMQTGGATFANLPSPNYPDVLPLNCCILQLPFLGLKDPVTSAEIYMQLLDEFPEMMDEMAGFNMIPIAATPLGTYDLHFRTQSKIVKTPSDLNGLKMVPYSSTFLPLFKANNSAGTYIPPGQIYESLEKGIVDGYINNWAFQGWFGLGELMTQHMMFGEYGSFTEFNVLVINSDYYNALPADLQKIWVDTFRTNGGYKKMWDDTANMVKNEREKADAKGDITTVLTDSEIEVWKTELLKQHRIVLDDINAKRGDTVADDIYNRIVELIAEKVK
jgi:TRAP-type C4-dicarboxylate transport system substrate-binding protein